MEAQGEWEGGQSGRRRGLLEACARSRDMAFMLAVVEKMRACGLQLDSASGFFWDMDMGEEEHLPCPVPPQWHDLPAELLMEVMRRGDDRTVVSATGVCRSWRTALGAGTQELSLSWCPERVNSLAPSIGHIFPNLQVLSLRRCTHISDESVQLLAASCRQLRALDLSMASHVNDGALLALADSCPALEVLDLSGCGAVGESGIRALAAGCASLRHLNLCSCEKAATDSALQALAQGCPQLQLLNVGWCEALSDAGVVALANGCAALEVLDLCGCLLVTDASVEALAEGCPRLTALGLHCCRRLTDRAMHALVAARHRHLAALGPSRRGELDPSHNSSGATSPSSSLQQGHLTLAALNQRTNRAPAGLVSLNLSGCTGLHAPAVQAVIDAYPELHTCQRCSLNFSGCLALTSVRCRCAATCDEFQHMALRSHGPVNPSNRPL